ncbi:glycine-rich cell wall structural protein 1-like [Capsicum annuum]|uniref:glycine-rich cell wall structural protein 1-like n=1 Tax=Capsicum annuum TaxID=4072 RepID=UPI001FB0C9DC|nr:glycine-rich cell wall structural protein 1-like [Capsicum annuum]
MELRLLETEGTGRRLGAAAAGDRAAGAGGAASGDRALAVGDRIGGGWLETEVGGLLYPTGAGGGIWMERGGMNRGGESRLEQEVGDGGQRGAATGVGTGDRRSGSEVGSGRRRRSASVTGAGDRDERERERG